MKYTLLEAQTFDPTHYGFPEIYYQVMESDHWRIGAFARAFQQYDQLKDAVVCEAGVGRLALSQLYLPYVKKAYLIESNPHLTAFIKKELYRNGWSKKTEFIVGDAMQVTLPEPVDYIIGELMSIYCAHEYQVQIFQHLRQFLRPEGKLIPEKIINTAQLSRASYEEGHTHYPLLFSRHWPELLSTQSVVNEIDLYQEEKLHIQTQTPLTALLSGQANSILMRSLIQLAPGINFTGTDSLMPPTVKQLLASVPISTGQTLQLHADYHYGGHLDNAMFWV